MGLKVKQRAEYKEFRMLYIAKQSLGKIIEGKCAESGIFLFTLKLNNIVGVLIVTFTATAGIGTNTSSSN